MKKIEAFSCLVLFISLLSCVAFSMGGGSPAKEANAVVAVSPEASIYPEVTQLSTKEEIEIAKEEINSIEAQINEVENELNDITRNMIKARTAGDSDTFQELKKMERNSVDREQSLRGRLSVIKAKYPELKDYRPPEKGETIKTIEVPRKEEKPNPIEKPKSVSSKIVYHYVTLGDTLSSISKQYYGTNAYYKEIAKMNGIADAGNVPQGMRLKIDLNMSKGKIVNEVTAKPAIVTQPTTVKQVTGNVLYHYVSAGETMMSISRKYYNTSSMYLEIAKINGLADPTQIKVGMKLKIDLTLNKPIDPNKGL